VFSILFKGNIQPAAPLAGRRTVVPGYIRFTCIVFNFFPTLAAHSYLSAVGPHTTSFESIQIWRWGRKRRRRRVTLWPGWTKQNTSMWWSICTLKSPRCRNTRCIGSPRGRAGNVTVVRDGSDVLSTVLEITRVTWHLMYCFSIMIFLLCGCAKIWLNSP